MQFHSTTEVYMPRFTGAIYRLNRVLDAAIVDMHLPDLPAERREELLTALSRRDEIVSVISEEAEGEMEEEDFTPII